MNEILSIDHPATKATYFDDYDESHPGNPHKPKVSECGRWISCYTWDESSWGRISNCRTEFYTVAGYDSEAGKPVATVAN